MKSKRVKLKGYCVCSSHFPRITFLYNIKLLLQLE
nr:MAG TPA: hypothetical protein [Caudoviricetes sp.]